MLRSIALSRADELVRNPIRSGNISRMSALRNLWPLPDMVEDSAAKRER